MLTEALAFAKGKRGHELGEGSPALLLRRVECTTALGRRQGSVLDGST